eukprot:PhM_4_TR2448/c2_g4_i1/m.79205
MDGSEGINAIVQNTRLLPARATSAVLPPAFHRYVESLPRSFEWFAKNYHETNYTHKKDMFLDPASAQRRESKSDKIVRKVVDRSIKKNMRRIWLDSDVLCPFVSRRENSSSVVGAPTTQGDRPRTTSVSSLNRNHTKAHAPGTLGKRRLGARWSN